MADADSTFPAQAARPHRWHAVTLVPGATACAAAMACKDRRYLSFEAPRMPLEGCDAARCDCTYRHFTDRRGTARRTVYKRAGQARVGSDRRGNRGRRASD